MNYPIVKTPRLYGSLANCLPNVVKPTPPKIPSLVSSELYSEFEKDSLFVIFSFFSPAYIITLVISLMAGYQSKTMGLPLGIVFSICVIGLLFAGQSMFEVIADYGRSLFNYNKTTNARKADYQLKIKEYEQDLVEWQRLCEQIKDMGYLQEYRRSHVPDNLRVFCKKPIPHDYCESFKKGVTENAAMSVLSKRFENKVLVNHTVTGSYEKPFDFYLTPREESNHNLTANHNKEKLTRYTPLPDFIIHDPIIGYSVVIELDEPYDLEFGYPIHYAGKDDARDEYFLNYSWSILRFTEKQFLEHPNGCCDYIADYINSITLGLSRLKVNNSSQSPTTEKCWSLEDAISMEKVGTRESYLPISLLGHGMTALHYKTNGPEIRRIRREKAILEEAEAEERRVSRLKLENLTRSQYSGSLDEENDLPF